MTKEIITQKRLKELLHYNPDTGIFTRLVSRGTKAGSVAGYTRKDFYIRIMIDGKCYLAHRLAWLYMTGEFPDLQIDHINHNPSDNRFCNLRDVTNTENCKNQSIRKNNTSGCTGVSFCKPKNKWGASISINGKLTHLGYFDDISLAIKTRKEAEIKYSYHYNHGVI